MEKELIRDEQYPLDDREALDIPLDAGQALNFECQVSVAFRDGQRRHFSVYDSQLNTMNREGKICTLKFCHPNHGEMMEATLEKKS